jgi:hypothetical protein
MIEDKFSHYREAGAWVDIARSNGFNEAKELRISLGTHHLPRRSRPRRLRQHNPGVK